MQNNFILFLSRSPISTWIITMILILMMRVYFCSVVFGEGIDCKALHDYAEASILAQAVIDKKMDITEARQEYNIHRPTMTAKELFTANQNTSTKFVELPKPDVKVNLLPKEDVIIANPNSVIREYLMNKNNKDPVDIRPILEWYAFDTKYCLNKEITTCTTEYKRFIHDFVIMINKKHINYGNTDTFGFLLYSSYYTNDLELINIAKAYIFIGYVSEGLLNNVTMTNELFTEYFNLSLAHYNACIKEFDKVRS